MAHLRECKSLVLESRTDVLMCLLRLIVRQMETRQREYAVQEEIVLHRELGYRGPPDIAIVCDLRDHGLTGHCRPVMHESKLCYAFGWRRGCGCCASIWHIRRRRAGRVRARCWRRETTLCAPDLAIGARRSGLIA